MATSQMVKEKSLTEAENKNLKEIQSHGNCQCCSGNIMKDAPSKIAEGEAQREEEIRNLITVVVGVLKNQTQGELKLLECVKWAGHIVKNYPNPLNMGLGFFGQGALSFKGVEAGVAYSGNNREGVECVWIIAWADTRNLGQRIYAACGAKEKFMCIDWNAIRKELEEGGAVIKVRDPDTATAIYAGMVGYKEKDVMGAAICG